MHQAALMRHQFANAKSYGWKSDVLPEHDWTTLSSAVQMYIRSLNWGHKVQLTEKNITYINGKGSFVDKNTIQAVNKKGKKTIIFGDNIVLAVGGRPRYPNIPGAEEHCISSDDIFWQQKPPGKTLVVGSSYVGLECAGFLHGLGFNTTLMIRSIPLRGFDQQIAHLITDHMAAEKMKIQWSQIPKSITKLDDGILSVESETLGSGETSFDRYDTVLLAIGRDPVTSSLDLDQAEVQVDEKSGKIIVDDEERTNIHNVYAIGDVAFGRPELTPVAIKAGKLLARRLFSDSNKLTDYENVPTTVFTPLEYSCVGLSEEDAIAKYGNSNVEVYHAFYKPLEYALPEQNHEKCYIKMVSFRDGSKPVIGLHFLGPNAGEVMQGFAVAMRCGVSRDKLASTVGIHPTCAEEIVKLHITKRSGLDPTVTGC
uniref:thioredoxin-disulfide reductase (NADPH) n=1 Tax=Phallusia mammillata TaxID=59560 RepID=A0A6F9DVE9_9ASCI|nr:thioredoxin reductase 3 [Phallusia mammillata]